MFRINRKTEVACIEDFSQCIERGDLYIIVDDVQHLGAGCKLAMKFAIEEKHPSLYYSLAFSNAQMIAQFISLKSGIPVEHIINDQIEQAQYKSLSSEINFLHESPLYIDDNPLFELDDVCSKTRNLCGKTKLEYIIIDGLLSDNGKKQIVIEQTLTALAIELNVAIILVMRNDLVGQNIGKVK